MQRKLVLILLFLFCSFILLNAMPYTFMGKMKVPTAYVLPDKVMELSFTNYMSAFSKDFTNTQNMDYQYDFGAMLSYGIKDRVELAVIANGNGKAHMNAKANLITEGDYIPAVAIGADNLFSEIKDYRDTYLINKLTSDYYDYTEFEDYIKNSYYMVLSKTVNFSSVKTAFHVGAGHGRFEAVRYKRENHSGDPIEIGHAPISSQLAGAFMGMEISPVSWLNLVGEYDAGYLNVGADFNFNTYFTLSAGAYRVDDSSLDKTRFAVNMRYVFDVFAPDKYTGRYSYGAKLVGNGPTLRRASGDKSLMEELERIRDRRKQIDEETQEYKKILEEQ